MFDWDNFWSFRQMITPLIIRYVFGAGVPIIPIAVAILFCEGAYGDQVGGRVLGGLFFGVLLLPFWRIACEGMMVAFSINDRLGEIAAELKKREQ